ncbi:SBBP repeat-containing protein [Dolichospermum sp. ST_sed7]|nr:SBBP repeat-containing protein [Dolichospermum sp. ST_sed7]
MNLQLALDLAYNQLNTVAQSPEYWTILNSIFGANYNSVLAQTLQQEWQAGNFSTLPPVEILNSSILGKANGAYAASNNTIYLADTFVATATSAQLVAVLLEEIGHAVDAKINSSDTPGDEGELFSLLVRGITPSATELSRIQSENDQAIITLNGQPVAIEMAAAEPTVAWAKSFGSIYRDIPNSITVDSSGNVYTTGSSILNPGWTIDFDLGPGTSNVTSAGDDDVFIIKLNSDGSTAWVKRFGGTGNDFGVSIKLDSSGNIYTTGGFQGTVDFDPGTGTSNLTSAGGLDVFISKLNSDGSFAWAKSFGGTGTDFGTSIKLDSSGNIYTTGTFQGTADFDPGNGTSNLTSAGSYDVFVSKLNSDGSFAWAKSLGGTLEDIANSITVDSSGNIYTTGYFNGTADFDPGTGTSNLTSAGYDNVFVSKLNSDGSFAWAKSFAGGNHVKGYSIQVDSSGNVYTAGWFSVTADFDPGPGTYNLSNGGGTSGFVSKLNSDGSFAWVRQVGSTGYNAFNYCYDLKLDSSGNVYVTGKFQGTFDFDPGPGTYNLTASGNFDEFIYKLNSDGSFAWAKNYGSAQDEGGSTITVDSSGNIYNAGTFGYWGGNTDFGSGLLPRVGQEDIFVMKLTAPITNSAPTITSAATATFAENGTGTVYTVTGTDPDAGTILTYSISGTDANLFNINSSNGAVTFKTAPNFEAPGDNVYDINVIATDNGALTATQAVAISVTNVNEAPVITSAATATFAENGTGTVYTATATDVDAGTTLTYSLSGTDANLFNINNGAVTFKTAPNFEVPTDNGTNNVYDINVIATDNGALTATQAVAITVTNVNDAPVITSAATATFAENGTGTVYTVTATDADAGATLTYSLSGTDANLFNLNNGVVTFKTAPNFELPSDSGVNNVYDINVIASDGALNTTQAVAITVTDVNDVQSSSSYTLNSSQIDLALTGTANINGTGNSLNNVLFGNSGNNILDGRAGADTMSGGTGNDFYYVDNISDSVIELANQGIDKVFTTINYTLTANVEDLGLQGTATNGTGNELNNTITGNELNNVLIGFAGDDTLIGGVGADTMTGGTGNDWY